MSFLPQPLPLVRQRKPFSHSEWIFEIKYDGFRALACLDSSGVRLISRNANRFSTFDPLCQSIAFFLSVKTAVLDGEIVCLDERGCSQFNKLLSRRGEPTFCAFDLLSYHIPLLKAMKPTFRVGGDWLVCPRRTLTPSPYFH